MRIMLAVNLVIPILGITGLISTAHAENQAQAFCNMFVEWSDKQRLDWITSVDEDSTFPALTSNLGSAATAEQSRRIRACLEQSRNLYSKKIVKICQDGMTSIAPFQEITKSRVSACINKVLLNKSDPAWSDAAEIDLSKKPFCQDWKAWSAEKRHSYLYELKKSVRQVIERNNATKQQRKEILRCYTDNIPNVISRLDRACKSAISYEDAANIIASQGNICARLSGLDIP